MDIRYLLKIVIKRFEYQLFNKHQLTGLVIYMSLYYMVQQHVLIFMKLIIYKLEQYIQNLFLNENEVVFIE